MAKQPILIIVCGGSGSGKTTVANEIKRLLPKKISCQIISMDTFYKPLDQKYGKDIYAKYNFDHPNAFDWELMKEKLFQLTSGKVTEIPVYDYCSSSRLNKVEKVKPTDIIIFEGILSLHDKDIANKAKIKIFIDTPSDERLIRRMMRDKVERKRTDEDIINQ
jgi:uridine kinase